MCACCAFYHDCLELSAPESLCGYLCYTGYGKSHSHNPRNATSKVLTREIPNKYHFSEFNIIFFICLVNINLFVIVFLQEETVQDNDVVVTDGTAINGVTLITPTPTKEEPPVSGFFARKRKYSNDVEEHESEEESEIIGKKMRTGEHGSTKYRERRDKNNVASKRSR